MKKTQKGQIALALFMANVGQKELFEVMIRRPKEIPIDYMRRKRDIAKKVGVGIDDLYEFSVQVRVALVKALVKKAKEQ